MTYDPANLLPKHLREYQEAQPPTFAPVTGLESPSEVETLRALVLTLLGRIEALERAVTRMREKEIKVRQAVGQLAAAHDLLRK